MKTMLLVLLWLSSPAELALLTGPDSRILSRDFDSVGYCELGAKIYDMRRVLFIENPVVEIESSGKTFEIYVERESFYAKEINKNGEEVEHFEDVDSLLNMEDDLDIELKLAQYKGDLMLFWRETFKNRIYKQGLFLVDGPQLKLACKGEGGSHIER